MAENRRKQIKVISTAFVIILAVALIKFFLSRQFDSVDEFQAYMSRFGIFAPIALTFFQAFQVVVPVLPGYLGCAAGAVAFGSKVGFWCNYIGICAGSIAAYFLAKRYGMELVLTFFSREQYEKWHTRILRSRSYDWFLFAATLLPLFPDDFLCYFSGVMRMEKKRFIWIILLGKPWCILAYSIAFGLIK